MEKMNISNLIEIVANLRNKEKGCPWDIKQTMDSILPGAIEETYELVDAILRKDWDDTCGELGDLLLQVVFLSQIASEEGKFEFEDVAKKISQKLISRHPHVFADTKYKNIEEQLLGWEKIKNKERSLKGYSSVLDDIPKTFPSLLRATKIQKRCASQGFDWDNIEDVFDKVKEEVQEVEVELYKKEDKRKDLIEEEIGDLLFSIVNLSRHAKINPEVALLKANNKFESRFRKLEQEVLQQNKDIEQLCLTELDKIWDNIKLQEKN